MPAPELDIRMMACLPENQNYAFLVRDKESGLVTSIDSPDPDVISAELEALGWSLDFIWNTHHHWDHVDGNLALKERWGARIVGPGGERRPIPGIDVMVGDGETVSLGASVATVWATPGHTLGHIAFHFPRQRLIFVGDTIFAMGCGRLFEGTPQQMYGSLQRLASLPPDTQIYCAHEYTLSNARFAITVDSANSSLAQRVKEVEALRARGAPTVPTTIADELATNPFLRADAAELAAALNMRGALAVEVFAELRQRKDTFR